MDIEQEIIDEIRGLEIDCPDCVDMYSDDQYTCTTCWCVGGRGKINVAQWISENPDALRNKNYERE